ncbi:uncharacterized protein LOC133182255 [Saccostrea echinata]|uniref:uncharacterized protein LOC133182255 n=1 Tax=Saccostrea echinata TaxID=191078 RepID=UPI002A814FF4|nr:uncharacterized protein LOC133182255 [Saccostrea echinata]
MAPLDLIEGCKLAAVFSTGYMAGAGIYVSLVEVQSRRSLPAKALWQQFTRSFKMAAKSMLASTLVTASAPTYLYFALEESPSRNLWLVSPACFLIGSIYTFTIIIPEVNVILDEKVIEKKGEKWLEDAVERWNSRHLFRTVLNAVNFGCMILAAIRS